MQNNSALTIPVGFGIFFTCIASHFRIVHEVSYSKHFVVSRVRPVKKLLVGWFVGDDILTGALYVL